MRKLCVSLLGALMLAALAVGCGSGSNGGGSTAGGGGTSAGTSADYNLRWAETSVPNLDPVRNYNQGTDEIAALALEGLTQFDKTGKVQPNLAESISRPDPTTYVYKLRPGVKFSDGKPLTAEDVVFTLNRYRGRDSQQAAQYGTVKSVKAQGDTVVVKLTKPDETWPVTTATAFIQEKANVEKVGSRNIGAPGSLPIGTGPWKFDSFDPDVAVQLSPNPYWRGPRTQARNISIKMVKDASATVLALRSGEIDGTFNANDVKTFQNIPGVQLLQTPAPDEYFVSFNTLVKPFDDVHVRRAIAYAIDREGWVKAALNGAGTVDDTLSPPSSFASFGKAAVDKMASSLRTYPYDLAAARRELAQSRYPHGFTTTTTTLSSLPPFVSLSQIMAADLKKIGITMKIKETTTADWLAILYGPRDKFGLFIDEYGGLPPDPNSVIALLLDPAQARVNGLNSANVRDPTVGKLLAQQRGEPDPAKRLAEIGEVLRTNNEQMWYQPIAEPKRLMALSDKYVLSDYSAWMWDTPWAQHIKPAS